MTYSITWLRDGHTVTETFDGRADLSARFKQLQSDSTCTVTQYINGAARYDINDPPVISDVI